MAQGKRYSSKERKEILAYLESHTYQETADKFEISQMSLARWSKNKNRRESDIPKLLSADLVKKIQIYLNLLERSETIQTAVFVTVAGELVLSELKEHVSNESKQQGFSRHIRSDSDILPILTNFLMCGKGFTQAISEKERYTNPLFDNLSIWTPVGTFLLKDAGIGVLVILFESSIDLDEIMEKDYKLIKQIAISIQRS